jgi:hypothetical protein
MPFRLGWSALATLAGRLAIMGKRDVCRAGAVGKRLCWLLLVVPACTDAHFTEVLAKDRRGELVQEGTFAVRDGEEVQVTYNKAFQAPPRLELVGFVQSVFKDKPYSLSCFEIVEQTPGGFKVRNNHSEPGLAAWAEVKWRATGAPGRKKPVAEMTKQERISDAVEKLGGHVTTDAKQAGSPIVAIDLHQTRVKDADLTMLHELTDLRKLNLFGTAITDAGLDHLSGLTGLQTLHLNATAIGDAGLQHLRGLRGLSTLSLYGTRVTDAGLEHLMGLTNLQSLALGGTQITDLGLEHLKGLRELRQLSLSGTKVTPESIQRLEKALPRLQVMR